MPYQNRYYQRNRIRPYRRRKYNYYKRKRWYRPRYRIFRKALRRRRQKWVRKPKFLKRKKKKLFLQQWQPDLIRTCKIKGNFTLFQCTETRLFNNYPQYQDSWVPLNFPSGGGWGITVFNLGALFQQFLRVRNWWTYSNIEMPLCRYLKCKLTFYRTENVDYVVYYTRDYPMTDNEYRHADACPNRMLMRKNKIIVRSLKHKPKKPYIRKTIKCPKLLCNKWFFQRDFINTNLFMLTATSCSLENYSTSPTAKSNIVYLKTLNPKVFLNLNYHRTNTTEPWHPKAGYYLYSTHIPPSNSNTNPTENVKYKDLTFLGQCTRMTEGTPIGQTTMTDYFKKPELWGNIFEAKNLHKENFILVCNVQPGNFSSKSNDEKIDNKIFTYMTDPIFETVAYNPDIDTGKDTSVYFLPNFSNNPNWNAPGNEQLIFSGFPLHMLLWGWPDWQKKLGLISNIDEHYIIIVNSPYFNPNLKMFMFIDDNFINNLPVYYDTTLQTEQHPLLSDQLSWFPKFKYQQQSINKICSAGPGTYKFKPNENIHAHMHYVFYFKWGGSPTNMETIADPEKQPRYPTPCDLSSRLQIQDPTTDPASMLYKFDFRRNILTQKAAERLKHTDTIDDSPFISTDQWTNPQPPQKQEKDLVETILQTYSTEKEKEETLNLFRLIRDKQQHLSHKLQRLILQAIK
nr:MAG: ORF1 [TTV-like mini virus]